VWLHLAKHDQQQRLTRLAQAPETRWRVGPEDWKHVQRYEQFAKVCTQALRTTSPGYAPWTIVEGYDAGSVANFAQEVMKGAVAPVCVGIKQRGRRTVRPQCGPRPQPRPSSVSS
jgi:hypothetical protein